MALVTLKEILKDADEKKYAVGMFNIMNSEILEALFCAAEAENSPVILSIAEVHMPNTYRLQTLCRMVVDAAQRLRVPACVHIDHGMSPECLVCAMREGVTSVMFDGSTYAYEKNVAKTAEINRIAKYLGVSVEAELGHVAFGEGGVADEKDLVYTDPQMAREFVARTGVDALAVSIGTAHGNYKSAPQLDFERLKAIKQAVGVPLVLHGGSGLSDDDFRACIRHGISKINYYTDIVQSAVEAIHHAVNENYTDKTHAISYTDLMEVNIRQVQKDVQAIMRLFGSSGRA